MNKSWFVCQIKFNKEDDKGNVKKVQQSYLIDAISYTEAEARIYKEMESIIKDFQIGDLRRSNLIEVFHYEDSEMWYKCKITYNVTDDDTEKVKKVSLYVIVSAHNIKEAYERIEENYKNMLVPYTVVSITESPFEEVFVHQEGG
ncbi:MAG: DUF4494 domain-containing protein [Bacteroidetes bacterium]|nr:MAG: DUF4494 domain-containing protein [Bacteroidota bacterium]